MPKTILFFPILLGLISFFFGGTTLYAQEGVIRVPLVRTQGYAPLWKMHYTPSSSRRDDLAGIPSFLKEYAVYEYCLNPLQRLHEERRSGKPLSGSDRVRLANYREPLSDRPLRHTVYFLSGFLPDGRKVIIADSNNNEDFSDDEVLAFDELPAHLLASDEAREQYLDSVGQVVMLHFERFDGRQARMQEYLVKIFPYPVARWNDVQTALVRDFRRSPDFILIGYERRQASFTVGDRRYNMALSVRSPGGRPDNFLLANRGERFNSKAWQNDNYRKSIGDSVLLAGRPYDVLLNAGGDTLLISPFERQRTGPSPGKFPPPTRDTMLDGKAFDWRMARGKYVLLEFWGTWCGPCREILPSLKVMHEQLDTSRMVLLGVAADVDREKVRAYLDANGIGWPQLFESVHLPPAYGLVRNLGVSTFPSLILLGPDGRILHRFHGVEDIRQFERGAFRQGVGEW